MWDKYILISSIDLLIQHRLTDYHKGYGFDHNIVCSDLSVFFINMTEWDRIFLKKSALLTTKSQNDTDPTQHQNQAFRRHNIIIL